MPPKPRLTSTLVITGLLLLVFFVRAHESLAMPAFNDESLHIRRSEIVWTFENPATSFTVGKLLGYYWLGAFGFDRLDALHGGRLVYALFILIGAAATYRVGRSLFNHAVGLLALLLYACAPYLVFYERLILADQLAASFGMLTVWAGIRLARRPTRVNGLLGGIFITFAVLAKLTAIPFALVPLAAILILNPREPTDSGPRLAVIIPRRYWPALVTGYGFNLLTGLPFMLFPLFREVSREPVLVVGTDLFVSSGWDHIFLENVPRLWDVLRVYFGLIPILVIALLIGRLLRYRRRETGYLIVCMLLPWSLILPLSPDPSNRYWLPGIPPLLVIIAAALWTNTDPVGVSSNTPHPYQLKAAFDLTSRPPLQTARGSKAGGSSPLSARERGFRGEVNANGVSSNTPLPRKRGNYPTIHPVIPLLLIAVWIAVIAAPFMWYIWTDPLELTLTDRDRWEYYENFGSGYGLDAAVRLMPALPISRTSGRIPVAGLVGSCHQLRLYLPEDGIVDLSCPFFGWQGEYMDAVIEHIQDRMARETVVYLLVEPELRFTNLSLIPVNWELVERFPRPWDGMAVELYRVYPSNE